MKEREHTQRPQEKDRHLDIPSEANRDKHINFLESEEAADANSRRDRRDKDEELTDRQKQWREGIEEGKKARDNE